MIDYLKHMRITERDVHSPYYGNKDRVLERRINNLYVQHVCDGHMVKQYGEGILKEMRLCMDDKIVREVGIDGILNEINNYVHGLIETYKSHIEGAQALYKRSLYTKDDRIADLEAAVTSAMSSLEEVLRFATINEDYWKLQDILTKMKNLMQEEEVND